MDSIISNGASLEVSDIRSPLDVRLWLCDEFGRPKSIHRVIAALDVIESNNLSAEQDPDWEYLYDDLMDTLDFVAERIDYDSEVVSLLFQARPGSSPCEYLLMALARVLDRSGSPQSLARLLQSSAEPLTGKILEVVVRHLRRNKEELGRLCEATLLNPSLSARSRAKAEGVVKKRKSQ